MKIFVCVKQVPDLQGKVYLKKDGSLDRARMATVINPDDMSAVETALTVKEKTGAEVIAVTMGPPTAGIMMHELYAMGVDKTYILSARELAGSDSYGTSTVLAAAINYLGFSAEDMILCGQIAIDGDTAQVGPEMAEKLGINQVTNVVAAAWENDAMVCTRAFEDCAMNVAVKTPCLICCKKETAVARYMQITRILDWNPARDLTILDFNTMKTMPMFNTEVVGLQKAPTINLTSFGLPPKKGGMMLEGSGAEQAAKLTELLSEQRFI